MRATKLRDDFPKPIVEALAKRGSFICSNPDCRSLTLCPSEEDPHKFIYVGVAAHITAAAPNGPRFDTLMTSGQRSGIENAIFLCATCATMIDKNEGLDFPTQLLRDWKTNHETWVKHHLNKSVTSLISTIDGEHYAKGLGIVTGLDAQGPVILRPGTKITAEGAGRVTAVRISSSEKHS